MTALGAVKERGEEGLGRGGTRATRRRRRRSRATHPLAAIFFMRKPFAPRFMAEWPCSMGPVPCGSCAWSWGATCMGAIDSVGEGARGAWAGEAVVNSKVGADMVGASVVLERGT